MKMIPNGIEREAWLINNPALGAYMLWVFSRECISKNPEAIHPSKIFCVLPFLFYADTRSELVTTSLNSNMQAYISKFSSTKSCASDIALSIHHRVEEQKEKTLEALITAFGTGLLMIDSDSGLITPNMKITPIKRADLDVTTKELFDCSRRLGKWFSDLKTEDITRIIKVVF
jgi:hypothetical protein